MRRPFLPFVVLLALACGAPEPPAGDTSVDTGDAVPATGPAHGATPGWLGDTTRPLAPAPRAPARLAVDSSVAPGTIVGTSEPATPLCATGLRDPASGVTLRVVRSTQTAVRSRDGRDSTMWGRADYEPSDPARFGLAPGQVLRVDCATRAVLGVAPDITKGAAITR